MLQLDLLEKGTSATPEARVVTPKKTSAASAKRSSSMLPPSSAPASHAAPDGEKAPSAFKTISEAAEFLGVPQHVLRFWESRFPQIKPLKLRGGRRYYRPEDMEVLTAVKNLLYKQGYTIKGARKAFGARKPAEAADAVSPAARRALSEKQKSQLSVIRHELMGLRDVLKPYVF